MNSHLGGYINGGDNMTHCPKLWEWAVSEFKVKSVIDVGCAQGYSAAYFHSLGCEVLGLEGDITAINSKVYSNIVQHDFIDSPYTTDKRYDMIWSCEFVEHVEEEYKDNFLTTFTCADIVFMTHALPGQCGYHHVNLKDAEYWIDAVENLGFNYDDQLTIFARGVEEDTYFSRTGLIFRW